MLHQDSFPFPWIHKLSIAIISYEAYHIDYNINAERLNMVHISDAPIVNSPLQDFTYNYIETILSHYTGFTVGLKCKVSAQDANRHI